MLASLSGERGTKMQALSKASIGNFYTIKWMFGLPHIVDYMHSLGIQEGSVIHLVLRFRDGMIIGAGEKRLYLTNEVAERIQV